jgi:hypothetical protein
MDLEPSERLDESDKMAAELNKLSTASKAKSRTCSNIVGKAALENKLRAIDTKISGMLEAPTTVIEWTST